MSYNDDSSAIFKRMSLAKIDAPRQMPRTQLIIARSTSHIIMHLAGRECRRISSFGGLSHFTRANQPAGAPDRCSDGCPHEADCPYSAIKVYGQGKSWGKYIGLDRLTQAQRDEFVKTSHYGRCVYVTDNDVVDHQVVAFEFEGGATGTFTMTAFAPAGRKLRVHGTHGYLAADVEKRRIEFHRFWGKDAGSSVIEVPADGEGTHDGGDFDADHRCGITFYAQVRVLAIRRSF